ncbi:MAG: hypothetical protein LUC91_01260 [Prevotella sp.]|nr:hypothetical protein [Prevotella sp.]
MLREYYELETESTSVNCIQVKVSYSLGGYNAFTHVEEPRGYYMHVTPVLKVHDNYSDLCGDLIMIGYFSGRRVFLKEVKRKSKKAEEEADNLANTYKWEYIEKVCNDNGLVLKKKGDEVKAA